MDQKMKPLGESIRNRRKALSLTQRELADFASCGEAFIHLLEHGKPTVRLDKVLDVLYALGLQFKLEEGKEKIILSKELS